MTNLYAKPLAELSRHELIRQEHTQKRGVWVLGGALAVLFLLTVTYWFRQDFAVSNPIIYCMFGLAALSFLTAGVRGHLAKIRAELRAKQ